MIRVLIPTLALLLLPLAAEAIPRGASVDVVDDALAFTLTDREKAARLLEDALEHEEGYRNNQEPFVLIHTGEQRRLLGHHDRARAWFEAALELGRRGWENDAARLGLALIAASDGIDAGVLEVLQDVRERDGLETQNADRYLLLAVRALDRGDPRAVREYSRKALAYGTEDPAVYERVRAHLEALTGPHDEDEDEVAPDVEAPPVELLTAPVSDLDQAEAALAEGDGARVRTLVERIRAEDPSPADARAADYLLRRIDAAAVRPDRIGVLLPLSGRFEGVGRRIQTALEYGWTEGGGRGELVFVDSGADPESAVEALERLALEEGVITVLGPLLTDETTAVAEAAQALRIPLVGLAQSLIPDDDDDWIFSAAVTPRDQAIALAEHVMSELDMSAFAVFAPDNNYGRTAAAAFEEAVTERDGTITVQGFYDPESTHLVPFAQDLGRKDYDARRAEFRELQRLTRERGGNPDRVVLPPEIDFDALFLPEGAARIPLAAAALAYEEFPVGEFQTRDDQDTIPLLGLSGWNHEGVVSQGGAYVRGAIFTDAFLPDGEGGAAFAERWEGRFDREPTSLEAVAVDAGRLVATAAREQPESRSAFREALLEARAEGTLTGAEGFTPESRAAKRQVRLLTILPTGEITPLDEPPDGPEKTAGTPESDAGGGDPL